jgi:hypothetical protein
MPLLQDGARGASCVRRCPGTSFSPLCPDPRRIAFTVDATRDPLPHRATCDRADREVRSIASVRPCPRLTRAGEGDDVRHFGSCGHRVVGDASMTRRVGSVA